MTFILTRDLTSERSGKLEPKIPAMLEQTNRLVQIRDEIPVNSNQFAETVHSIIDFQCDDGSFSYLSDYHIPSDARVDFIYHPTYICCQILTKALLANDDNESVKAALRQGLEFSCSRNLMGHGIYGTQDQVRVLQDFIDAGITDLLHQQPDICPEFTKMLEEIANDYVERIENLDTYLPYGDNITVEMMRVAEALGRPVLSPLFVYGTLMEGEANRQVVMNCAPIGKARIAGFQMYNLGAYPGIKRTNEPSSAVLGELILCNADTLERIDALEQEGHLYNRVAVNAKTNGESRKVYTYEYNSDVSANSWVPEELQPWSHLMKLKETHVWYVAYGSNLLRERFMCYIKGGNCKDNGRFYEGCDDTTAPLCDIPVTIPYSIYFGNRSASWGNSGVAFLDTSRAGAAYGRAYLVTKEQLEQIHTQEGKGVNWYRDKKGLNLLAGIPAVTFTNTVEREHTEPSSAYLETIRKGLAENMPTLTDKQIESYLQKAIKR